MSQIQKAKSEKDLYYQEHRNQKGEEPVSPTHPGNPVKRISKTKNKN